MLMLRLTITTDEPHDRDVRRRKRLPRADRDVAKAKAWRYALNAIANHCDTADVYPTVSEKVAAGLDMGVPSNRFGAPAELMREAPSAEFPWLTANTPEELTLLQADGRAPKDAVWSGLRVAFSGRPNEDGGWDGWVLEQRQDGRVCGTPTNCHVIDLGVEIVEC